MARPLLLDLFCGAGGAAKGYHDAGFDVIGVDIVDQPNYPYEFVQAHALNWLETCRWVSAYHASPPCQDHSVLSGLVGKHGTGYLLAETRRRLYEIGKPYVIENVVGADMRPDMLLCGEMFGLRVYRHRQFELGGWWAMTPAHPRHTVPVATRSRLAAWAEGKHMSVTGDIGVTAAGPAMGIDWMNGNELSQAIPPAYTRYVGDALMAALASTTAAEEAVRDA